MPPPIPEPLQRLSAELFGNEEYEPDSLVEDMDPWTKFMVAKLVPPLLTIAPVTDKHLAQPVGDGEQEINVMNMRDVKFENLEKDNSCGDFPFGDWIKLKALQTLFPVEDLFLNMEEKDVGPLWEETQLDKVLPPPTSKFENPTSDEGLIRQAFYGLGSHRIEEVQLDQEPSYGGIATPENAVFKVDLMSMNKYKVRHGFAKYGACVYFDLDQNPIAIRIADETLVYPDQGYKWEVAKFSWRCCLITLVTAVDHLFHTHFLVAAQMLRASTEAFPADHPIKRVLQPFMIRTALINNKAGTALLPKQSILHHISGFTFNALAELAADTYRTGPEWQDIAKTFESKGPKIGQLIQDGKLPYYEDGMDLYKIFLNYFDKFVPATDEDVAKDEVITKFWKMLIEYTGGQAWGLEKGAVLTRQRLLSLLATFAYRVSAGHCHVGAVIEHVATPLHSGMRMTPNAIQVDKQSYIGSLILMCLTSVNTPALLSGFDEYWRTDEETKNWGQLQSELKELVQVINERNKNRRFVYNAANPEHLECAVSV